ncbi:hypothetical protein cce_4784 [Crocosphaera subtropica ATCC 51142]|uniref:Uncharacterized protein n=1 Tax=Crocosphaera subtropica (strain ATCC 51142 / BH68) TaxID=43989 RepID=B1X1X1_CROS5|nr:hypothetical protein [Crocosphaera subtropica]ACB54132.1 hypothetical protein cce_4784 [Crocosphaera subtropica ATCC 51142]
MEWITQYPDEVELSDEFIDTYRGWGIYLCIPNGGILAVSVSNGIDAYAYSSYPSEIDKCCDFDSRDHLSIDSRN